jgi:hypothetical protein
MPNWCDNTLHLRNSDKAKLDAVEAVLADRENQELFKHLRPYEGEWDYGWCCNNWGTKWESRIIDFDRSDDNEITVYFETAWGPPTVLYQYLYELNEGWDIEAFYHEPGMCFAGIWRDGGEDHYEFSDMSADEIEEELPSELNEMYGISEWKREWEEENAEDEDEELEWPEPKATEEEMKQALKELKEEFDRLSAEDDKKDK